MTYKGGKTFKSKLKYLFLRLFGNLDYKKQKCLDLCQIKSKTKEPYNVSVKPLCIVTIRLGILYRPEKQHHNTVNKAERTVFLHCHGQRL